MIKIINPGSNDCTVLYISHDGLSDPLGRSQIIPYLQELAKKGVKYSVLSYEKLDNALNDEYIQKIARGFINLKINWIGLRYHNTPSVLATFIDVFCGCFIAFRFIKNHNIKIIHARSYVSSLIAVILKKTCKIGFIFDMRGFWADERVEAGLWKNSGFLYRIVKFLEKVFLLNSDVVISLTHAAEAEIRRFPYLKGNNKSITVIPTCVNLERFRIFKETDIKIQGIENKLVLAYAGSISTWSLPDEMLSFFNIVKGNMPESHFLVITQEEGLFRDILRTRRVNTDVVTVLSANHEMVANYLSFASVGLAFYKPGYSRKGCCPTKIGEYLACGLPVIINSGIGDIDEIIIRERIGILINEFSRSEYQRAFQELKIILSKDDYLQQRCRSAAEKFFSLNSGVEKYYQAYNNVTNK